MERRELLKSGALLGAALAAPPGAAADDDDGDDLGPPVFFLEGTFQGDRFAGWQFVFSVAGSRAEGFAFDPTTVNGTLAALRFEGRARGHQLGMQVFALEDVNLLRPLGSLQGTSQAGRVQGSFALPGRGGERGTFQAQVIPVSEAASQRLAGIYQATAQDAAGRKLYAGALILRAGRRWEAREIRAAPGMPALAGGAAHRLTGRYAMATDGRLLLNVTRVPLHFRQGAVADALQPANRQTRSIRATATPVTFSDGDFAPAAWTATKIIDTTPGQAADGQIQQVLAGGNPGAYQQGFLTYQNGSAGVAVLRDSFLYDAASSGPIDHIDLSYDLRDVDSSPAGAHAVYGPLLRQGDSFYGFAADPVNGFSWVTFTHSALLNTDFNRISGSGPPNPDFSGAAGPIGFGYFLQGPLTSSRAELISGLDNYSATVTPVVQTPVLSLSGSATPQANVEEPYFVKLTDLAGQPVGGAFIVFQLALAGVSVPPATGRTDASGQVTFRHTFPTPGQTFQITVCLDQNRNGVCDPGELSVSLSGMVNGPQSLDLTGPDAPPVGVQVDYVATAKYGSGQPVPGAAVVFQLSVAGSPAPAEAAQTDRFGQARFRHTFDTAGQAFQLTACWDQNGNGKCDPDELSQSLAGTVQAASENTIELIGPEFALLNALFCYTAALAGPSVQGQLVFLFHYPPISEAPVAQGRTGPDGKVQLCFMTGDHPEDLFFTACWDLNGSGACDTGDLSSRPVGLRVTTHLPTVEFCALCCPTVGISTVSAPLAVSQVAAAAPAPICFEHPFTHLLFCATRLR
jgi:hypothetical protein